METPTRSVTEDSVAEHIPWQHLAVPRKRPPTRAVWWLVGVLGVAALGVVIGRATSIPVDPAEPTAASPPDAAAPRGSAAPVELVVPDGPVPSEGIPAPSTTSPLREADLLAAPVVAPASVAMARAEWFVTEYFSRLGAQDQMARIAAAGGWDRAPDQLADLESGPALSYVEWATSTGARQVDQRRFVVTVVLGRLVAVDAAGDFTRVAPESYELEVVVDGSGQSAVVTWPIPTATPTGITGSAPTAPGVPMADETGAVFLVGERAQSP